MERERGPGPALLVSQSAASGSPTTPGTTRSENRGLTHRALQTHRAEPTGPTDVIKNGCCLKSLRLFFHLTVFFHLIVILYWGRVD